MTDPHDHTNIPSGGAADTGIHDVHLEMGKIDLLREAITEQSKGEITLLLADEHPADISDQLEQLSSDQRQTLVELVPELLSPTVLNELEDEVLEDVLPLLDTKHISEAISELDSDDAIQLAEELDEIKREEVMASLPVEDRAELEASLAFDDETAGRLMQREFVAAAAFWTVGQTLDQIRAQAEKGDDSLPDLFFNVYIVDAAFKPFGYIPISRLMRAKRTAVLSELMETSLIKIPQTMDQEDIAYQFEKYHLISAPVVDTAGRLTGMITVDDIVNVIQEENKEDMLALAGVNEAGLTDTALSTVKSRAPWLFVNLLTAILASFVIAAFDYAISDLVALAVLMPIVASMGGNAGTQTLAVVVRALTERDLTAANAAHAVRREAMAALLNGLIFAVLMALVAFLWFSDMKLAGVVFAAMLINHICAGLAGILIPLGLNKAGADPAVASSVFVTTVTDVIGFFAFLGIAAAFLL